jgi:hypothetical protein
MKGKRQGSVFILRQHRQLSAKYAQVFAEQHFLRLEDGVRQFSVPEVNRVPVLGYTSSTLEADVGIGRLKRRFRVKNAPFC